jgi:hypothetical protein
MSDDAPIDPEQVARQDDLDYTAGFQARVDGLPAQGDHSPAWYRGWYEADRGQAEINQG